MDALAANILWLIPTLPLLSAALLMVTMGRLNNSLVTLLGAGSVGLAALCVAIVGSAFLQDG